MKGLYNTIDFEIEGLCDMKMDRWLMPEEVEKQPTTPEEYMEQSKLKVYANGQGLYIPANAVEGALRHAAYYIAPNNKKTKYKDTVFATVHVVPAELLLNKDTYDEIVRDVVTRGKGDKVTRVVTYRPLIKTPWKVKGQINFLGGTEMTDRFLKDALTAAGIRFGLLGHRPKFGRFVITKWKPKKVK